MEVLDGKPCDEKGFLAKGNEGVKANVWNVWFHDVMLRNCSAASNDML